MQEQQDAKGTVGCGELASTEGGGYPYIGDFGHPPECTEYGFRLWR